MTNPRLTNTAHKSEADFNKENQDYQNRPVLSTEEIDSMIAKADAVYNTEFFRLRAKCLVALLKKFGKRRCELGRLKRKDIMQTEKDLEFTFTLAKKRKKGLFQFLKFLEKQVKKGLADPGVLGKPLPELQAEWKVWQTTIEGHRIKNATSLQSISLDDKYTHFILEYLDYLTVKHPDAVYLFPSGTDVFGTSYVVDDDTPMSGRQMLRIVKDLNPNCWMHLFRNSKASEIARLHGRTLTAIQQVQDSLDLENPATALIYVKRHAPLKQPVET